MKRFVAIVLCLCLLSVGFVQKPDASNINQVNSKEANKYNVVANNIAKHGIDVKSTFTLTSKVDMSTEYVKNNLTLNTNVTFTLKRINSKKYDIIPNESLKNDTVYNLKLKDGQFDYSWAFQTEKKLMISGTYPTDKANGVYTGTGIEFYFNMDGLDDISKYISIEPKIKGKFVTDGNIVVFNPDEELKMAQTYTIKISKGFGTKDGCNKIDNDYIYSFKTIGNNSNFNFKMLQNSVVDNEKIITGNIERDIIEYDYDIDTYMFKAEGDFEDIIKSLTAKFYTDYNDEIINQILTKCGYDSDLAKSSKLDLVNKSTQKATEEGYLAKFVLPKELKKGYYIIHIQNKSIGIDKYILYQINDMVMYEATLKNGIFMFAGDSKTSNGIDNVNVYIDDKLYGKTGADGVCNAKKDMKDIKNKPIYFRLNKKGYNDLFYITQIINRNQNDENDSIRANEATYLSTDRVVYLLTDIINYWGFLGLDKKVPTGEIRADLVDSYNDLVIDSQNIKLSSQGTYQGKFDIQDLLASDINLVIYYNDKEISRKYIEINKYSKPIGTMTAEMSKKAVYSGEEIYTNINTSFTDGRPMSSYPIHITSSELWDDDFWGNHAGEETDTFKAYGGIDKVVKTNEEGNVKYKVDTNIISNNWRPIDVGIDYSNDEAEDKQIYSYNSFLVFPKHEMVRIKTIDTDNPQNVRVLINECDLSKYKDEDDLYSSEYESLAGKPLDKKVKITVMEEYHERYIKSTTYDNINKVNINEYAYKYITNNVYDKTVNVADGVFDFTVPNYNPERQYRVLVSYEDKNGKMLESNYINNYRYGRDRDIYNVSISKDNVKNDVTNETDELATFRTSEKYNIELLKNDEKALESDNDKFIIMYLKDGVLNYDITDKTNITGKFKEDYIPYAYVYPIYIKDGKVNYVNTEYLYYDTSEKEIKFDIKTDKEKYKPGDEVSMTITTRDSLGNPITADVNVSVVDEAYFNLYYDGYDILNGLYNSLEQDSGILYQCDLDVFYEYDGDYNEKSCEDSGYGASGDIGKIRDKFIDTAMYKTVTTSSNGTATLKFKLPDNITAWRITCQGVNSDYYAGNSEKTISSCLPVYVDMIMADTYLDGDTVEASLRAFGENIKTGDKVSYKVQIKNKDTNEITEKSANGVAGQFTSANLGNLKTGRYEVTACVTYNGSQDTMTREINVVDSLVYFNNVNSYKVTDDTKLLKTSSNATIRVHNESSSVFVNALYSKLYMSGQRIEQKICPMVSAKIINDLFGTKLRYNEVELYSVLDDYFENCYAGYKILPCAQPSLELTAVLGNLLDTKDIYYNVAYLYNNISDFDISEKDTNAVLWCISKYDNSLLLTVQDKLNSNKKLELREKLYLMLALLNYGDNDTVYKYYKEIIDTNTKEKDEYLYIENNISEQDNYELTALMSIIGVKLQNYKNSDRMFKYIYCLPSKYVLTDLEQLIYIKDRNITQLDEVKNVFGEFTINFNDKTESHKLSAFETYEFSVKKDDVENISFSNIKGDIACDVIAIGNKNDLDRNKDNNLGINVTYKVNGKDTKNTFNLSDKVEVTISPKDVKQVDGEYKSYEITYIVPSGFRYMGICGDDYVYCKENGQKLVFYQGNYEEKKIQPIKFYIQAVQKGQYTCDYAVIRNLENSKLNYSQKSKVIVK